jgi:hypothetical protein
LAVIVFVTLWFSHRIEPNSVIEELPFFLHLKNLLQQSLVTFPFYSKTADIFALTLFKIFLYFFRIPIALSPQVGPLFTHQQPLGTASFGLSFASLHQVGLTF